MCGINGFTFRDSELLRTMNRATAHRGPDGGGFFEDEHISLGHNLLAITETADKAKQPWVSSDKNYVLVYNGEIYNYQKLKKELQEQGEHFQTNGDTEVLFAGLRREGVDFIKKLEGMFAFAWYDKRAQELFLVRDPSGIKPLYYYHRDGRFIFSSELRGVLVHDIARRLNYTALNIFLTLGYVPGPSTLIEGVQKVSPGQCITIDLRQGTLSRRWYAEREARPQQRPFNAAEFREMMGASVVEHTMGLRPFGLYLSGGLDSTIVLHELATRNNAMVQTYTTRFETSDSRINEDADFAKRLSESYNVNHHELLVTEQSFIEATEKAIETMEGPRYNHSVPAYWLLAREAAQDVTVVLNGSGGDELFLGYPRYRINKNINERYDRYPDWLLHIGHTLKEMRRGTVRPGHIARFNDLVQQWLYAVQMIVPHAQRGLRFSPRMDLVDIADEIHRWDYPAVEHPLEDRLNAVAQFDRLFWLADEEFIRTDKIAMHFGMEGRFPFLADRIVRYANAVPSREKLAGGELKSLTRRAYADQLPDYILNKHKTGWTAPVTEWMHSDFGAMVREVLSRGYYDEANALFDFDEMKKAYIDGKTEFTMRDLKNFLPIFSFQMWARVFNVTV